MIDGKSLRKVRQEYLSGSPEEKRVKQALLLEKMGISSMNFIFKLERDGSKARLDTVLKLSEALECDPAEIISEELFNALLPESAMDKIFYNNLSRIISDEEKADIPEEFRRILENEKMTLDMQGPLHVIDIVRTAGESVDGCPKAQKGFPNRMSVELPYENCDALEIADDSLMPFLKKGDVVLVSRDYKTYQDGDLCEICVGYDDGDKRFLRRIYKEADVGYQLQPLIPSYRSEFVTEDDIEWVYKVVATSSL